jgi:crotonobetainyl-CoA:carnitine CoA-transferase CaiB-like acyl-CoA transferase
MMVANTGSGPLSGITVLDMTSVVMGPFCTLLLASLGADIVKLETPEGDVNRDLGPRREAGLSGTFIYLNHNKKSIAVDLRRPEGREILWDLIGRCDVLVLSIRPGGLERMGLDYEKVRARNPGMVFCNLFGFGRGGSYFGKPAYDDTIQAVSGLAMLQGEMHGEPAYVTSVFGDKVAGISAAYAIIAALYRRQQDGLGQEVDVPMFEVLVHCLLAEHATGHVFRPSLGPPVYKRPVSKHRKPFRATDGYISVIVYTQKQFKAFFSLAGRPEVVSDPRFCSFEGRTQNSEAYYQLLGDIIATRSCAEWESLLDEAEIPCAPLNSTASLYHDPHLAGVDFFREIADPSGTLMLPSFPITFSRTPARLPATAPRLGEQGEKILEWLGYDPARIARFHEQGVIGQFQSNP